MDAARHGTIKKDEDVEMKDNNGEKVEEKVVEMFDHTGKRLVGPAAKAELKRLAVLKHDEILYRGHN